VAPGPQLSEWRPANGTRGCCSNKEPVHLVFGHEHSYDIGQINWARGIVEGGDPALWIQFSINLLLAVTEGREADEEGD
jgi:hypothetical protein